MLLSTTFWKNSSMILDLVLAREQYYKNLAITQTALDWTAKIVANNFNLFLTEENLAKLPIQLDFSFLTQKTSEKNLYVIVDVPKKSGGELENSFYLAANLCEKEKKLCKVSCQLFSDENFKIKGKTRGFLVKYYTIGGAV